VSEKNIQPVSTFKGTLHIPGDKSISHRAAILGLLAEGETVVTGFLQADDCMNTLHACESLGAKVVWEDDVLHITGVGLHGLQKPAQVIDCGNSGTGVRLLSGVLAGQDFESEITGDEQIQRRPMNRIIKPLEMMGAGIESQPGGKCPLKIKGGNLKGIEYQSPVASAQVKSCILLAGLFAAGETSVTSPSVSRDHSERMLKGFGVQLTRSVLGEQSEMVSLRDGQKLTGQPVNVPVDISSAAFFMIAALLITGSELVIPSVGINPTRTGVLSVLEQMGAEIEIENERISGGEAMGDIIIRNRQLLVGQRIETVGTLATFIDEVPILTVAAAMAQGDTEVRNAEELRVKETDRIHVLVEEMKKIGVAIEELEDGMIIHGTGGKPLLGGKADSHGDHRLAMSLAIAGLVSEKGVTIENSDCVKTSFPGFWELLAGACV